MDPCTTIETAGRRFPCGRCGARLEFQPGTSSLRCPYCGHENQFAEQPGAAADDERDFRAALAQVSAAAPTVVLSAIKCQTCAAAVQLPEHTASLSCPFCGSNIVAMAQTATLIKPNCILPFRVTRERAVEAFRSWVRSRWFAPNALRKRAMVDAAVNGIYLPAWTYDAEATTWYTGQRGDAYYVTETYTTTVNGRPVAQTRQVRRIRWTSVSGMVDNSFDDLLVMATRSLPAQRLEALRPWDLKAVVEYRDDYLAGFRTECYQVDLAQGFEAAEAMMRPRIEAAVCADIGGDEQRIDSMQTRYLDVTFKHLLLPVWVSAYRYADRVYQFLVNARTGEVQGDRPYSWVKITLAVLAGVAAIAVVALVAANR